MEFLTAVKCVACHVRNTSIDFVTPIIAIFLPKLMECFQQMNPTVTPRAYLMAHYDQESGEFDSHLIKRHRWQARQAAIDAGKGPLKKAELDEITRTTFLQAIDNDQDQVLALFELHGFKLERVIL